MQYRSFWRRGALSTDVHLSNELKVVLEKIWDNFKQVQLIKLSQVLGTGWESM